MTKGLADTSLFIANENGRDIRHDALPDELFLSVVTLAELEAGVLAARDVSTRATRLRTLEFAKSREPLSVDSEVASHWARLRLELHAAHRRVGVNDLWIAATAVANSLPVVTQDGDFDVLAELGLVEVIRV